MSLVHFLAVSNAILLLSSCGEKPATPVEQATNQGPSESAPSLPANPTAMNAASVSQGSDLFHKADCRLCHGKLGDGRGFLAEDVRMKVHDWRDPAYSNTFTDSQLYAVIFSGKGQMPAYGTRNTPTQIWLMVDYIRSLGAT